MWRVLVLQCVLFQGCSVLALSHKENETFGSFGDTSTSPWSPRGLGKIIAQCLGGQEMWECLANESERLVDAAARDNCTWQISDYLSIEPQAVPESRRRMDTGLAGKLLELVQGRALRVKLPRQLTISNAIDDFGSELGLDQGTYTVDDKVDKLIGGWGSFEVLAATPDKDKDKDKDKLKKKKKKKSKKKKKKDKDKDKDKKKKKKKPKKKKKKNKKKDKYKKKNKNCSKKTGRKKKDKDKHMAMMGGMIMMATLAQMFLGKVILIAGSAFIMAKIALVISLLGSLKKGSTGHSGSGHGGGGGGTEHVVVHSSHESGWHRSMPTHDYASSQLEQVEEPPPLGGPMEFYQAYQMEPLKRRLHQAEGDPQHPVPEATKPTRGFL